jgi:hypothetical protein
MHSAHPCLSTDFIKQRLFSTRQSITAKPATLIRLSKIQEELFGRHAGKGKLERRRTG